jgi:hypothetical protein
MRTEENAELASPLSSFAQSPLRVGSEWQYDLYQRLESSRIVTLN